MLRVGAGFVRAERSRNSGQHGLGRAKIKGILPARNVNKIPQVARLTIGRYAIVKGAVFAGVTEGKASIALPIRHPKNEL